MNNMHVTLTLITSGVCWMRRVDPVSLAAAGAGSTAASLAVTATGMATGAGASSFTTGGASAESVGGSALADAGVTKPRLDFGSLSTVEDSVASPVVSAIASGVDEGRVEGSVSAAGSEDAPQTVSGTAGAGEGNPAEDCFGGIAGTVLMCKGVVLCGAGGWGLSTGVSALPVVASVPCRSFITSRSFPLFLSALPVLPAPESTSSWAKLSMLSRILSSSAPSSSSPTTASVFSPCGGVKL